MGKKLTNNQVLVDEIIKQEYSEQVDYQNIDEFFEFYTATHYLKNYDLSFDEIISGITGSGGDGGCDGIYLFLNGYLLVEDTELSGINKKENKLEFIIIQNKNTNSFKEDVFDKWKTISKNLLDLSSEDKSFNSRYNREIIEKFRLFKDTYIGLIRRKIRLEIRFVYISKGIEIHPNVLAQSDELKTIVKDIFPGTSVDCNVNFITADNLMEIINTEAETEISLKLKEKPINFDSRRDYIALVGLDDYYKFITTESGELIRHIFESNVRDYQGNVMVNKEIQNTLLSYKTGDFWWLNNGITIIANNVNQVSAKEILINEPEIVNGLQTSTEIFNYFSNIDKDKIHDNRSVLVRVIVPETDEERDKIILATNNQTNIPKASLRATDSIHRQIELYFKSRGFYYDRRKNYYKNQGKKSSAIVTIPFLSQCLMSIILQKPDYARARPSTLIAEDETYYRLFSSSYELGTYFNIAKLGKYVEHNIKNCNDFSNVEKGDILFYVLYYVVSIQAQNLKPDHKNILEIDHDKVTEKIILDSAMKVYGLYKKLGGNGKVAKGPDLIKEITKLLEVEIGDNELV